MKKLVRMDGTHHICRLADGISIPFQPFLKDEAEPRPHTILDDDMARKVLATEKGEYEVENLPEPKKGKGEKPEV